MSSKVLETKHVMNIKLMFCFLDFIKTFLSFFSPQQLDIPRGPLMMVQMLHNPANLVFWPGSPPETRRGGFSATPSLKVHRVPFLRT